MKRLGELMQEMGFRPDASEETKKAFLKNLIRQAAGTTTLPQIGRARFERSMHETIPKSEATEVAEQLSFVFEDKKLA